MKKVVLKSHTHTQCLKTWYTYDKSFKNPKNCEEYVWKSQDICLAEWTLENRACIRILGNYRRPFSTLMGGPPLFFVISLKKYFP